MLMYEYNYGKEFINYSLYYFPDLKVIIVDKDYSGKIHYRMEVKSNSLVCNCMGFKYHNNNCQHVNHAKDAFSYNLWDEGFEPRKGFEDYIYMKEKGLT